MKARSLFFLILLALVAAPLGWGAKPAAAQANAVVGDGTPGSCTEAGLRAAWDGVLATGGTITFDCAVPDERVVIPLTQALVDSPAYRNSIIIIDGGDYIDLDAQHLTRHFDLNVVGLTLQSIVLLNGESDAGGAIRINSAPIDSLNRSLYLRNALIYSNHSTGDGGAIWAQDTDVYLYSNSQIRSNIAEGRGGGIYSFRSELTHDRWAYLAVTDSGVTYNTSNAPPTNNNNECAGGGIYASIVRMRNSEVLYNSAQGNGGGLCSVHTEIYEGSRFTHNTALNGGAIYAASPFSQLSQSATINDATFDANTAQANGGALNLQVSTYIVRSTFSNNTAANGGAVYVPSSAPLNLSYSTLSGNSASDTGGAILQYVNSPNVGGLQDVFVVEHSTLAGNQASSGNAIGIVLSRPYSGQTLSLWGSILGPGLNGGANCTTVVQRSIASIVPSKFVSKGWNISSDGSCNLTLPTDKPNTDPHLAPLDNYGGPTQTMRPLPGSPAVFYNSPIRSKGACSAAVGGAYDQRHLRLPSYGCDTGSVEVQPGE